MNGPPLLRRKSALYEIHEFYFGAQRLLDALGNALHLLLFSFAPNYFPGWLAHSCCLALCPALCLGRIWPWIANWQPTAFNRSIAVVLLNYPAAFSAH
jgi:hypothetical protein